MALLLLQRAGIKSLDIGAGVERGKPYMASTSTSIALIAGDNVHFHGSQRRNRAWQKNGEAPILCADYKQEMRDDAPAWPI